MNMNSVYLIADGPSRERVEPYADLIKDTPVAVVNRAFYKWKGRKDYWFSLHPDLFFKLELRDRIRQIAGGIYQTKDNVYERNEWNKWGTTSLFAAEYLLEREKFDRVIMYGVDLTGNYAHYRSEEWFDLYDRYEGRLIDKSYTQWLAVRGGPVGYIPKDGRKITREVVTLIGGGPSKHEILHQYDTIEGDVAVVNGVMHEWKGSADYWFTLHPTVYFLDKDEREYTCRKVGVGPRTRGTSFFEAVSGKRLYPKCGTSARFAAERLLDCESYEQIHIYGVDLDGDYKNYRAHWNELIDKHKDKIIDHSVDKWIQRRIDATR